MSSRDKRNADAIKQMEADRAQTIATARAGGPAPDWAKQQAALWPNSSPAEIAKWSVDRSYTPAGSAPAAQTASQPASAAATVGESKRFKYDAPQAIDYGDEETKKKRGQRKTLLAGETGGYNPATGQQTLGIRSLLG